MASLDDIGIQRWRKRRRRASPDHARVEDADVSTPAVHPTHVAGAAGIEQMDWAQLEQTVTGASQCSSCAADAAILGEGNREADWVFIINAPSQRDLDSGRLLTGRSGDLFTNILAALGMQRDDIYLAPVCKCVRQEDAGQLPQCANIIHRQLALIQPKVVFALGETAARAVIKANETLDILRSQPQSCFVSQLPVVASFALPDVLREPILKAAMWQDLKQAMRHVPVQ